MSYILDALRRADAERERGQLPGLHSRSLPGVDATMPAPRRLAPWVAGGAAVLVLAGVVAGWMVAARRPAVVADAAPKSAAPAPAPAPVPPPAPLPRPAPPRSVAAAPAPPPQAARVPAPAAPPAAAPAPSAPASAVARAAVAEPAAAPASSPPIIAFERLPDDIRRQLPALAIGGAIYSDSAASRMLIVAGQLLREGDAVAPGVTLEQIRPRSAVLRWKGLRYEVIF